MEPLKNEAGSDGVTADLAKKLSEGQPMQAGKFNNDLKKAAEAVVAGKPAGVAPSGQTFDQVLMAIKQGKKAHRKIWESKSDGSVQLFLTGAKTDGDVSGLSFERGEVLTRAGLHNDDILANDWIIH